MEAQMRVSSRPLLWLLSSYILCCFLSVLAPAYAAPTTTTRVDSLPGFDGALPFRLEIGYVTVDEENGAELFYYFIESEGDPRRDPLVLWLTGGDRCAGLNAFFFEIGPLKFITEPFDGTASPCLRYFPYGWTRVASVIIVDSPVGAGFSFSRDPKGYDVGDVKESLHLREFLYKWFAEHPDYLANPFYIGADSRAGKIAPFLAQIISEEIEAGRMPTVNLKGYLVGNPVTGEGFDYDSRVPYLHGVGVVSDQLYESIMEHCQGEDHSNPRNVLCAQHMEIFNRLYNEVDPSHILYKNCGRVSSGIVDQTQKRKILKEESGVLRNPPAQPSMDCRIYGHYLLYYWANNNITRENLGIKKGTNDEWLGCHDNDLPYSTEFKSSIKYHHNMTLKGYCVLVYSGDHDALVPFLGTQYWVRSLNFPIMDEWRSWHVDGQSAGFTIGYVNKLTFATVKGGGHTAPEYQPERCFAMFKRWISELVASLAKLELDREGKYSEWKIFSSY